MTDSHDKDYNTDLTDEEAIELLQIPQNKREMYEAEKARKAAEEAFTETETKTEPTPDETEETAEPEDSTETYSYDFTDPDTEDSFSDEPDEDSEKKASNLKSFFEWVEMFAVYFAIGIALLMLFFRHCPVNGESMMNTLNHEDVLILSTFCYTPENGDMIVCQSETYGLDRPLVKRIIAVGGQTVKIDYKNWTVTVDGVTLEEDYIWKREGKIMHESDYLPNEFTVPEGYVFVMGDNRNNSKDSRSSEIGFIDERYIVGKVWIRISPNFTVFE